MTHAASAVRLPTGQLCPADEPTARVLAQKAASAYVVVRMVRLLQARGVLPGHQGLTVWGVHVHHLVHGGLLLGAQHVVAVHREVCVHRPARANAICIGAALVIDEFDILTRARGRSGTPVLRAVLDVAALVGAAFGAADHHRTWLRRHHAS